MENLWDSTESSCIPHGQRVVFLPSRHWWLMHAIQNSHWEVLGYTMEEAEWGVFGFQVQLALSGFSITWLLGQKSIKVAICSGGNYKNTDSHCPWNTRTENVTKLWAYKIVSLSLPLQTETVLAWACKWEISVNPSISNQEKPKEKGFPSVYWTSY